MKLKFHSLLAILLIVATTAKSQNEPLGILLTWTENPSTTMSIDWHTADNQPASLSYRPEGEEEWKEVAGKVNPFPYSDRFVHRVALNRLKPGTTYQIRFGEFEQVYSFRTMPDNLALEPVRIAIGGDTMHEIEMLRKTNSQVVKFDPHFVVMGGDMAYENGAAKAVDKVHSWFETCKNTLITENNRIIPIVVGIGNHEVAGGYYNPERFSGNDQDREKYAPYFYSLYAFPGHPGYNVLDFGNYLSLFMLDSGHNNPIEGEQTAWLEKKLNERKNVLHKIPVYHVGAYPSARDFTSSIATQIRFNWLPLFEEHNVKLAFENHDHTYKRTFPIKRNEIHENGIVFVGDGAWGVYVRETHKVEDTWYLNKALSQRHFILLTLHGSHQQLTVVNEDGQIIDSYP